MKMGFENILVRILNRPRQEQSEKIAGLYLGEAKTLIGGAQKKCSLPCNSTQHTFVCGGTGRGKTTLLLQLMAEHFRAGVPFLFIDFHGHATECLLALLAATKQARDVVLFEPWSDPVVGWNPLESSGEWSYPLVQELVGIFHRRLWPDAWGPRLEELLRMTLLALTETKLTLLEATTFISRPEFRRAVLQKVSLPEVREFWALRFERLSPSQRSLVSETVLNKLSAFHDPALKYVVGQERSTLDFDRALQSGQTIIANLSAGSLRGNNYLLAALLVAKLKAAVYHRPPDADPYAVFLDEFQEMFALDALDDYLRSFRKFGCSVYLATQHLQLPPELKAAIFGNCARFFCFATSASDAALLSREFGGTESSLVAELLPELPTGQAIVKVRGEPTYVLRVTPSSIKTVPHLVAQGREMCLRLGKTRAEVEEEIKQRLARFSPSESSRQVKPKTLPLAQGDKTGLPEGYEGF
jgi:hypothetical protein